MEEVQRIIFRNELSSFLKRIIVYRKYFQK